MAGTQSGARREAAIIVIYAIIVEESVSKLLLAGFLPGLVSALIYAGIIIVWAMIRREHVPSAGGFTWGERVSALPGVMPIFIVVFIIISAIYGGWATPTEAGALDAAMVYPAVMARGFDSICFGIIVVKMAEVFSTRSSAASSHCRQGRPRSSMRSASDGRSE
jgi:TRAP-type C4-dicarboxylate transport system permease large subunit